MRLILAMCLLAAVVGCRQASTPAAAQSAGPPREANPTAYRVADNVVSSRNIRDASIGSADLGTTLHVCNVAAAATNCTSTADPKSVGGKILGVYWAGNMDQFVDNVVLNANGSVTVTLGAAATAINNLRVVVAHGAPVQ